MSLITRTSISKSNTIFKGCKYNFGLNPISMLHYGNLVSRFLIYFDINQLKEKMNKGLYTDINKLTHKLFMFNCGSIDNKNFHKQIFGIHGSGLRNRTSSFDIIAFKVPSRWDAGVGFDSGLDMWENNISAVSDNGSTWYQAYNGKNWNNEGIYSLDFLGTELIKYNNKEESVIVAHQHFDYGNEHLELDLTNYINNLLNGIEANDGLCISFSPLCEDLEKNGTEYVGFFNNNTNTFFAPFLETRDNTIISDSRNNFINGQENELLFYVNIDGELNNLDELPICTINDIQYPVTHKRRGIYSAMVKMEYNKDNDNMICYDIWSNIKYKGDILDDIEMEFVILPLKKKITLGKKENKSNLIYPIIYNINDCEELKYDELREVKIEYKEKYTNKLLFNIFDCKYRIYVLDGENEITVVDWDYTEHYDEYDSLFFNTSEFLPNTYFIDLKMKINNEEKIFKEVLKFKINGDLTKKAS